MQANISAAEAGAPARGRTPRHLLTALTAAALLFSPLCAQATQGETYGTIGGGYQLRTTGDGVLNGALLLGGIGWFPSDFTVSEVTAGYTLAYQGGLQQLFGVQGHFRVLIDAFEWVPSVGPLVGVTGAYTANSGFEAFMDLGVEGCLAWRGSREEAFRACGQVSLVPAHTYYQSLFSVSFSYDWFFGM